MSALELVIESVLFTDKSPPPVKGAVVEIVLVVGTYPDNVAVVRKFEGFPVRGYASVMPYPAKVVGFPVRELNDCAGTELIYPLGFVELYGV